MALGNRNFVKGRFEGSFKTLQDLHLSAGEPFPEGDKHLIRIYRGVVSESESIDMSDFESAGADIELKEVNNIQICKTEKWPEDFDRIYSFHQLKLTQVEISGVHSMNGHSYGNISGFIVGVISENIFEYKLDDGDNKKEDVPWWDYRKKEWWGNNFGNNHISHDNDIKNHSENTFRWNGRNKIIQQGCLNPINRGCAFFGLGRGCLNWLFRLFLFLLLLYFLFNYTEWGEQLICRIQVWRKNKEVERIMAETTEKQDIINRTKPVNSECGGSQLYQGNNQPKTFTYTLGTTSGKVKIAYNMFGVPDRMEVVFNGQLMVETKDNFDVSKYPNLVGRGFACKADTLEFDYLYKASDLHELTIRMIPNEEKSTTEWTFNVMCP
jgi:hypothetical protein